MTNREISETLRMIGTLLEILDDNSFRANAYYTAGRHIEALPTPIYPPDLDRIPGVGKAIKEKVTDMLAKGHSPYLASLRAEVPPGLLEILRVQSLGPKRVRALWRELGVTSIHELEEACREGRLTKLKGFGEKLQEKITQGILWLKQFAKTYLLGQAVVISDELISSLEKNFHVKQFHVVGSVRRGCELVHNLDVLTTVQDKGALDSFLRSCPLVESVEKKKEAWLSATLSNGVHLRLHVAKPENLGASMVFWTGSHSHVDRLIERAKAKGLAFSSAGLSVETPTEEACYKLLGLPYIEPELREDTGEFQAADLSTLPQLLRREDLVGTVHVHTLWSDGVNKLEEMVEQAVGLGFQFIGITDHSKAASYAGGLTVARLAEQAKEIAEVQKRFPQIRILHGTECDILPDGTMDFPDETLKRLDFVVASIHSNLQMPEEAMTARVIRALENPYVDILGHPTGRLLLARDAIKINLDKILDAIKRLDKTIEINANPHRLDIETRWIRLAKAKGVRVSIDPDAHNRLAVGDVDYGVTLARRGWVSRETVLNAVDPERAYSYFKRNR